MAADISLLDKRPSTMTADAWREKRRDAARELGTLGDKRAVPPLIHIVETERFDAIGMIAIESLGKLGDKRAVLPLRKVYADASRDRETRDTAAEALKALGENPDAGAATGPEAPPPDLTPPPDTSKPAPVSPLAGGGAGGAATGEEEEAGPITVPDRSRFADDVIATVERWTLAVGSLALTYDTVANAPQLSGAATTTYVRGVEKKGFGWTFTGSGSVAGGAQDRNASMANTSSFELVVATAAAVETRFYLFPDGLFAAVEGGLDLAGNAVRVQGNMSLRDFSPVTDVSLGLGMGYGRTIDVSAKLRLQRVEAVLRRGRLLGRPIPADVAAKIFTAWWNLRGELGSLARVLETLQLLRDAGVLLTDPDPATVYRLIRVLEDGQLDGRREGWDARLAFGETMVGEDDPNDDSFGWHRQETLFARAEYAHQLPHDAELVADVRGLYRFLGTPTFYLLQGDLTYRRYFYSGAWDPRGALELGAIAEVSDPNKEDMIAAGTLIGGRLAYVFFPNRASKLRVGADVNLAGKELFFGVHVDGTFGFLSNSFAAW